MQARGREAQNPIRGGASNNEVDGLTNPTSEVLAVWIWDRLAPTLPGLARVDVQETCTSGWRYEGPTVDRTGPAQL